MELTRQDVQDVVDTYIRAWVEKDPDLIVTIFTETATYHERVLEAPIANQEGIREYWQTKVVESQDRIKCKLLSLFLDGNTAIVEWEAEFDDLAHVFMAEDITALHGRLVAVEQMEVGSADRARRDLDDGIPRMLDLRIRNRVYPNVAFSVPA